MTVFVVLHYRASHFAASNTILGVYSTRDGAESAAAQAVAMHPEWSYRSHQLGEPQALIGAWRNRNGTRGLDIEAHAVV